MLAFTLQRGFYCHPTRDCLNLLGKSTMMRSHAYDFYLYLRTFYFKCVYKYITNLIETIFLTATKNKLVWVLLVFLLILFQVCLQIVV